MARQGRRDRTYAPLGLSCIAIGAAAIWIASGYPYGTVTAMGPGFVPTAVSIFLIVLGLLILLVRDHDEDVEETPHSGEAFPPANEQFGEPGALKAMACILGSIILFGYLIRPFGIALTTFCVVVLAALGHPGPRLGHVLALALGLAVAASIGFVVLLQLQIPIWPRLG